MAEITAALVKELRDATNVGMMECKKALVDAGGDKDKAVTLLRERGLAIAGKKAARTANSGVVAADVFDGGRVGVMVEVNCETDFVARNETFQAFVASLLARAKDAEGELAPLVKDDVAAKIAEIGENIVVRRNVRFAASGEGLVGSYIHLGSKVGVLMEVGCGKADTAGHAEFRELVKDLTLHIAACAPVYLDRTSVPEAVTAAERGIYAKQVEGKPEAIVGKIVEGKLAKYFTQVCLVDQGFVKDPDQPVTAILAAKGKALGDEITIRRFARYQLGEEA